MPPRPRAGVARPALVWCALHALSRLRVPCVSLTAHALAWPGGCASWRAWCWSRPRRTARSSCRPRWPGRALSACACLADRPACASCASWRTWCVVERVRGAAGALRRRTKRPGAHGGGLDGVLAGEAHGATQRARLGPADRAAGLSVAHAAAAPRWQARSALTHDERGAWAVGVASLHSLNRASLTYAPPLRRVSSCAAIRARKPGDAIVSL